MYSTERALLEACVEAVRALDPDLLIGFDVQKACSSIRPRLKGVLTYMSDLHLISSK